MKNWKTVVVHSDSKVLDAIKVIDEGSIRFAIVVDNEQKLLGTITDGDIRRGLIKGISLEEDVTKVMRKNPIKSNIDSDESEYENLLKIHQVFQLPIVDSENVVVDVFVKNPPTKVKENIVFLMAGGLGSRLGKLTEECPKPLLKVGKKPILETIIEGFIESGFRKFYLSVNYKSQMIEEYFGNGSKWGVEINYINEEKRLGTAGSLSMLPENISLPVIVMNADLITKVDFSKLLDFHDECNAQATMCVREYDFQIPYGVVKVQNDKIKSISEKPVQKFFVNAGVYSLGPDVLKFIPKNEYFDMTTLFNKLIEENIKTSIFPIREYWIDVGKIEDFHKANSEYEDLFE